MINNKTIAGLLGLGALYLWYQNNNSVTFENVYVDTTSGMTATFDPDLVDEGTTTTYTGGGSGSNTEGGGIAYTDNQISFYDPTSSVIDLVREQFEPAINSEDTVTVDNRTAFLRTIQDTEGTSQYENPYGVIFGGIELDPIDYTDHPGNLGFTNWTRFTVKGKTTYSTAAGAYQFLLGTWNRLKNKLGLPDFSPQSQDLAALELIREKGALNDIDNGDVVTATDKVRKIWASLPGANYPGQSSKTMDYVVSRFNNYRNVA